MIIRERQKETERKPERQIGTVRQRKDRDKAR